MEISNYRNDKVFDEYGGRPTNGIDPRTLKVGEFGWLGNPFKDGTREQNIQKFKSYFWKRINEDDNFRLSVLRLRDKKVACFCHPKPCHLDVIHQWFEAGCPLLKQTNGLKGDGDGIR